MTTFIELIEELPNSSSKRLFYPGAVESGGQDGINIRVAPSLGETWIGTFARGQFGPKAITKVFTMPDPGQLCVVASGQAYIVNANNPQYHYSPAIAPVMDVRLSEKHGIVIFANHTELLAIGVNGAVWRTERLSWDSLKLTTMTDDSPWRVLGHPKRVRTGLQRQSGRWNSYRWGCTTSLISHKRWSS